MASELPGSNPGSPPRLSASSASPRSDRVAGVSPAEPSGSSATLSGVEAGRNPSRAFRASLALTCSLWLGAETVAGLIKLGADPLRRPGLVRAAFATPFVERRRRSLESYEQGVGRPRGFLTGIVEALLAHVPEHATVYATCSPSGADARALIPLPHLCFPRRIDSAPAELPDDERLARSYLLDLDGARDAWLAQRKARLATGPGWTLWH